MSFSLATTLQLRERTDVLRADTTLRWHEQIVLAVGILEVPLQIDKYFMYREQDASLGAVGGINISLTTICFAYLYAVWFGRAASKSISQLPRPVFGLPMLAYISIVAVSIFAAQVKALAVFDLALLVQAYAIFFYLANRLRTFNDLLLALFMCAATLAVQSLIVIGLVLLGPSAHGQSFDVGPINFAVWEDGRPAGTMQSAVLCGSILALLITPVVSLLVCRLQRSAWWSLLGVVVIGLLAILLTQTRGAIVTVALGFAVLGVALMLRGWLPRWTFAVGVLVTAIALVPLMAVIEKRVYGDDGDSAGAREHLTEIGIATVLRNPLQGYGAGNCHLACESLANSSEYRSEWYYTIHCKYLVVWIETGILGLLAFLVMMANGIRHGLVGWSYRLREISPISLALAAAISCHMVHMLVDIFNSRTQVQMLWIILGLSAASYRLARERYFESLRNSAWQLSRGAENVT